MIGLGDCAAGAVGTFGMAFIQEVLMADPAFDPDLQPVYGEAVPVAPLVPCLTVHHPSAFIFPGPYPYLLAHRPVAVSDPVPGV